MSDTTWESMADWYADKLAAGSAIHQWAVRVIVDGLDHLGGEAVLDLGCGEGLVARALAERGARVTGVDLSRGLIARARRQETADPRGIDYRVGDARTLHDLPDQRFAGVTANLCLNDIDELDTVTGAVARVLRPGGWFAFSVPHPCFETPHASWSATRQGRPGRLVSGYYDPAFWRSPDPQGVRRVGNYHRPVSTYLNTLIERGFAVAGIAEPRPPEAVTALHPGSVEVPLLLFVRAIRTRQQPLAVASPWRRAAPPAPRPGAGPASATG